MNSILFENILNKKYENLTNEETNFVANIEEYLLKEHDLKSIDGTYDFDLYQEQKTFFKTKLNNVKYDSYFIKELTTDILFEIDERIAELDNDLSYEHRDLFLEGKILGLTKAQIHEVMKFISTQLFN